MILLTNYQYHGQTHSRAIAKWVLVTCMKRFRPLSCCTAYVVDRWYNLLATITEVTLHVSLSVLSWVTAHVQQAVDIMSRDFNIEVDCVLLHVRKLKQMQSKSAEHPTPWGGVMRNYYYYSIGGAWLSSSHTLIRV